VKKSPPADRHGRRAALALTPAAEFLADLLRRAVVVQTGIKKSR